ncbi:hypothetical protein GmHk_01G001457 [Glycine max]|nr:hypothetical protein GmHk_01G001457 [Glycine max]
MARTKKTGQMTSQAPKEISVEIDSLEEQALQGSFVAHGRQDGLALPPEPEVGPSFAHVSTKESCVEPLGNDPDTVKVGVEEVRDADARIPVPTQEVQLVGQTLNIFLAWPTHLVKRYSEQTIPRLFLKLLQVMWDATVFGMFNDNFPLYIKHEDLSEIAHNGQCLSIFVIHLWILVHWKMFVILPKENVVIWFCSLHNRPNNYLKEIINKSVIFSNTFTLALAGNINILIVQYASMFVLNNALKGFDDTPQSKSKVVARWIVVKYFNDARPLEPERMKTLRIQWVTYYLKVKNETISV